MDPQQVNNAEKPLEKPRKVKGANPSKKEVKEAKEAQVKEKIKAAEPSKAQEESVKAPSRFVPNQVVNQYYPPMQSDMFSLAYRQPLLYPQQNYELLCMFQAVNQGTTVNPSNIWMPKVSDTIPPQAVDPLMAQQVPYSAQPARAPQGLEQSMDLLTRAKFLTNSPTDSVPLREHPHVHNEFCGHNAIKHNGHIDYIHNAELHYVNSAGLVSLYLRRSLSPQARSDGNQSCRLPSSAHIPLARRRAARRPEGRELLPRGQRQQRVREDRPADGVPQRRSQETPRSTN
eukprot:TRINITY_DN660_c0_g2_i2.p1 TRINITY_DN660_c0_g2~~TRINITY_DN660_c0_g2_i2.p1  ORF type:complete len:287 (-),score=26.62 TRINITY_DN660_c0_g2_i2:1338-2198(-)